MRKKKNKSGSVSVQIIQKIGRNNQLVKTIGSGIDPDQIRLLESQAHLEISKIKGQKALFESKRDRDMLEALSSLANSEVELYGPEKYLGGIYCSIGYDKVGDSEFFKELVISRLVYPGSKLKTVDYLRRYKSLDISVYAVYRYMDKLQNHYKDQVEQLTFKHFKKVLGGKIGMVFYDMTTLYFETPDEDDLRKIGYSKDGKHQHPQIKLGVLVGKSGFPIGYDIFEGSIYEGHTLIPMLEKVAKKFNIERPVVIADAGLLSNKNIAALIKSGYEFILGGRIKNESDDIKKQISELQVDESSSSEIRKDTHRLIVSYSSKRAAKDRFNRERGLTRLEEKVKRGKLDKKAINNRGYNKYLKLEKEVKVSIDYDKYAQDAKWDGLKGYLSNTKLKRVQIIDAYNNLWHIEKAFRISKTDLKIRPIYHRIPKRIKAHLCICFVAYAIYKELERILEKKKAEISATRAVDLTKNMYQIKTTLPDSKQPIKIPLKMTEEQVYLTKLLE
uniref:IS1634 family transposase n=1 Tax=Cyclobacterium roseum TaxID=2666137 RepID=UPI00192EB523|nr:IS1634 family transposase [Cyclobacterium roseum]